MPKKIKYKNCKDKREKKIPQWKQKRNKNYVGWMVQKRPIYNMLHTRGRSGKISISMNFYFSFCWKCFFFCLVRFTFDRVRRKKNFRLVLKIHCVNTQKISLLLRTYTQYNKSIIAIIQQASEWVRATKGKTTMLKRKKKWSFIK